MKIWWRKLSVCSLMWFWLILIVLVVICWNIWWWWIRICCDWLLFLFRKMVRKWYVMLLRWVFWFILLMVLMLNVLSLLLMWCVFILRICRFCVVNCRKFLRSWVIVNWLIRLRVFWWKCVVWMRMWCIILCVSWWWNVVRLWLKWCVMLLIWFGCCFRYFCFCVGFVFVVL